MAPKFRTRDVAINTNANRIARILRIKNMAEPARLAYCLAWQAGMKKDWSMGLKLKKS